MGDSPAPAAQVDAHELSAKLERLLGIPRLCTGLAVTEEAADTSIMSDSMFVVELAELILARDLGCVSAGSLVFALTSATGDCRTELFEECCLAMRKDLVGVCRTLSGMREDASIWTLLEVVCCATGTAIAGIRVCTAIHPDAGRILVGVGSGVAIRLVS
jgi:hypothetical protein